MRHGQASFGADDYDQLSQLGQRQCERLGHFFTNRGVKFDAAYTGTLKRHVQTLAGICRGGKFEIEAQSLAGLNEYDSQAVVAAVHPEPLAPPTTPELYRHHFRLLRQGLSAWMLGKTQPPNMPNWRDFRQGVVDVLDQIRQNDAQSVLLISSGGPIACAVGHVLATPVDATVELNMRLRNSSVTEFSFTANHHALQTYNTLPHLAAREFDSWISYA